MARIKLNDLPRSDALDREAMQAIVGGTRTGARPALRDDERTRSERIVDYPPGFVRGLGTTGSPGSGR